MDLVDDFAQLASGRGFRDFSITACQPPSWSRYMLETMEAHPTEWTMPWPGDHIYVHPDDDAFVRAMEMGAQLGADAVAYGHNMDFEFFLDWDLVQVLHNDPDYVMIEWGIRHFHKKNPGFKVDADRVVARDIRMPPVPGFAVYRSALLRSILEALPPGTSRWQDMEASAAPSAGRYKLLIPKQCLYRHVHGYWYEGFSKYWPGGGFPEDFKAEIATWYIPTEYDWRSDSPTREEYLSKVLERQPYFERYLTRRSASEYHNRYGSTPFDPDWARAVGVSVQVRRLWRWLRWTIANRLPFLVPMVRRFREWTRHPA